jgi:hypothetical protein
MRVSEPIALKIVDFNGGSYTGAILFTGFMYIGAAVFCWLVRAWKIGEMERRAAILHTDPSHVDPVAGEAVGEQRVPVKIKTTPFVKRLFVWQKV